MPTVPDLSGNTPLDRSYPPLARVTDPWVIPEWMAAVSPINYGARGDLVLIRSTISIRTNVPPILTVYNANFTRRDIGKRIYFEGAGPGGIPMATTITNVYGPTQVRIANNVSTFLANFTSVVAYGTDDTQAFRDAADAYRLANANTIGSGMAGVYFIPPRGYLITGPINFTDISFMKIQGRGALIYTAVAGKCAFDMIACYAAQVDGPNFYGDRLLVPTTAIQVGRPDNTTEAYGRASYTNISTYGYWSLTPFYNMASETTYMENLNLVTMSANAYGYIGDGCHHFGLTSDYYDMSGRIPDKGETNTNVYAVRCNFLAMTATSHAMFLSNAVSQTYMQCYWFSKDRTIHIYSGDPSGRCSSLVFDGTMEGFAKCLVYFDGPGTVATTCHSLRMRTSGNPPTEHVMQVGPNQPYVRGYLWDITHTDRVVTVFNDAAKFRIKGELNYLDAETLAVPYEFTGTIRDGDVETYYVNGVAA